MDGGPARLLFRLGFIGSVLNGLASRLDVLTGAFHRIATTQCRQQRSGECEEDCSVLHNLFGLRFKV